MKYKKVKLCGNSHEISFITNSTKTKKKNKKTNKIAFLRIYNECTRFPTNLSELNFYVLVVCVKTTL